MILQVPEREPSMRIAFGGSRAQLVSEDAWNIHSAFLF